jgi:hypothetical protein
MNSSIPPKIRHEADAGLRHLQSARLQHPSPQEMPGERESSLHILSRDVSCRLAA